MSENDEMTTYYSMPAMARALGISEGAMRHRLRSRNIAPALKTDTVSLYSHDQLEAMRNFKANPRGKNRST